MAKFVFDNKKLEFSKKKISFGEVLVNILKYLALSILLALLYYTLFALFFDTGKEKLLSLENSKIRKEYARMHDKMELVEDVINNLEIKDSEIYRDVFNSDPQSVGPTRYDSTGLDVTNLFEASESDMIWDTYIVASKLEISAGQVNRWITNINRSLSDGSIVPTSIPSIMPVKGFTIVQTGASVGKKVHPFIKLIAEHTGFDMMSPVGTEVLCTADGVVSAVIKSQKGFGDRVEVEHNNGYVTTYSHLSAIVVRKGENLKQGDMIGRVGSTGTVFAPCLHYEVIKDGEFEEPVNYFFSDLDAESYIEMLKRSMATGQSMD